MIRRYLERGTVFPSEESQGRYPLADFPCELCERIGLPHLVDNSAEYYWEHHHDGGREGCSRFGRGVGVCGSAPRPGTARPTYFQGWRLPQFQREASE